jgi:hypothetical protein
MHAALYQRKAVYYEERIKQARVWLMQQELAPLLDFVDAALKGEEVSPELYAAFMGGHHG